jgi:hypothetical protein
MSERHADDFCDLGTTSLVAGKGGSKRSLGGGAAPAPPANSPSESAEGTNRIRRLWWADVGWRNCKTISLDALTHRRYSDVILELLSSPETSIPHGTPSW